MFALVDRDDANDVAARAALDTLKARRAEPLLTNFIVEESRALLLARFNPAIARRWLTMLAWPVGRVSEADETRARMIAA